MNLRIPGPIPVDDDILTSMSSQMINHRGPEYKEILYSVTDRLKKVFETNSEVFILTASGTGGMEAAIVNTLSPKDKVINASCGSFGERFGHGLSVHFSQFGFVVERFQVRHPSCHTQEDDAFGTRRWQGDRGLGR